MAWWCFQIVEHGRPAQLSAFVKNNINTIIVIYLLKTNKSIKLKD
jgi:hypothetical protein